MSKYKTKYNPYEDIYETLNMKTSVALLNSEIDHILNMHDELVEALEATRDKVVNGNNTDDVLTILNRALKKARGRDDDKV